MTTTTKLLDTENGEEPDGGGNERVELKSITGSISRKKRYIRMWSSSASFSTDAFTGTHLQWIENNFSKKECVQYRHDKDTEDGRCKCGRKKDEHSTPSENQAIPSPGDSGIALGKQPTDAYGIISFTKNKNTAKYIRLADDTNPLLILDLMKDLWGLPEPELVLSVIGGTKELSYSEETQLKGSLEKVCAGNETWILTDGTDDTCLVRKASKYSAKCIGISPWGCVKNSEILQRKNEVNQKYPQGGKYPRWENHASWNQMKYREEFLKRIRSSV